MQFVLFVVVYIISVSSDMRNFYPGELLDSRSQYNKNRVWIHLKTDYDCYSQENDVVLFKDYLLSKYDCISFNQQRKTIYKHPLRSDYSVWSLWFEKTENIAIIDFQCLNTPINLPFNLSSLCVANVFYEPMPFIESCECQVQDIEETNEELDVNLWSFDILDSKDGTYDKKYRYPSCDDDKVEIIVIDTGVDQTHTEFSDVDPKPLGNSDNYDWHSHGHGTHVAATIVGKNVGGYKDTKLRYYAASGWSTVEAAYETAIQYMNDGDNDKRYVINFSFSYWKTDLNTQAFESWGNRITEAGGIWVTSAGNNNGDACEIAPSFSEWVLTVSAYDINLNAAWFTDWGSCVDVWAPGVDIWSAKKNGSYRTLTGTSMASPIIASIVANLLKMNNKMTLDEIKEYMKENARLIEHEAYQNRPNGTMNQAYLICEIDSDSDSDDVSVDVSDANDNKGDNYQESDNLIASEYSTARTSRGESHLNVVVLSIIICGLLLIIGIGAFGLYYFHNKSYSRAQNTIGNQCGNSHVVVKETDNYPMLSSV